MYVCVVSMYLLLYIYIYAHRLCIFVRFLFLPCYIYILMHIVYIHVCGVYEYTVYGCLIPEASLSLSLSVYTHMHVIHDCSRVIFICLLCVWVSLGKCLSYSTYMHKYEHMNI